MTRGPETQAGAFSARDEALLVRLADGLLDERRRGRAEALLVEIPSATQLVERQRRVTRALRSGPVATREARAAATAARHVPRPRVGGRARLALVVAGPVALAAVAFVLITTLVGGGPSIAQAAELTARPPERPAPQPLDARPLLVTELEGVPFPDWDAEFGWHAFGARDDVLGDRATRTVFYEHRGHLIGYTIVSGDALEAPDGAEHVRVGGVEIALLRDGDRDVAVFVRDGHTCVLAGHVIHRSTLVKLAAWRADGAVEF